MAFVLEYARPATGRRWDAIPSSISLTLLTYAHVNLCWQMSRLMLVPVCKQLGHSFVAWTPVAWLPGSLAMLRVGPGLGTVIMFLSSLLAGRLMQEILLRYYDGLGGGWRALVSNWRVWVATVLWFGWIPVPAVMAFIYQFSVWAIR